MATDTTIPPKSDELAQELSAIEDPFNPLVSPAQQAGTSFVALMTSADTVLNNKGGIGHLNVYRELLRDDQVASVWQQRRLALTRCKTVVEPGADDDASRAAAEQLQRELDAMNWDDITDKQLYALFYGWGVAEVMWAPGDDGGVRFADVRVRERARFRFDYEQGLHLWRSTGGFIKMPAEKFWVCRAGADNHDEPYGIGLAHALFWPVFFKRNDIKFWLTFLEKFGQPTTLVRLPGGKIDDPAERKKAVAMLRAIATDAGIVAPMDVPIELLEAARGGAADYAGMHAAMNAAISKIVLSQTMTTDDGSSRAQAQVHNGVKQQIVEADSDLLCGSFNRGPVRWWTTWNFPDAAPPRVYRHTEPPADQAAQADRDTKIAALGFEPTDDYIRETYGEGWTRKAAQAPAMASAGQLGQQQGAGTADPAQFAEGELAALQALRAARRGDQQALADAAAAFAGQYETLMGRRIGQILQAAEFADGDADLFRERLNEILAEAPPPEVVDKLQRGGMFARMLGALRGQRQ